MEVHVPMVIFLLKVLLPISPMHLDLQSFMMDKNEAHFSLLTTRMKWCVSLTRDICLFSNSSSKHSLGKPCSIQQFSKQLSVKIKRLLKHFNIERTGM